MASLVDPPGPFTSPRTRRDFLRRAKNWPQDDSVEMAIYLVEKELKNQGEPLEVPGREGPDPKDVRR